MYWLIQAYIGRFKFWGMVMAAIVPPALIGPPVGQYIVKLFGWDDQLFMGACFFALFGGRSVRIRSLPTVALFPEA